jgi:hypothetical protein
LSQKGIIEGVKKIKLAFPDLPGGFYEILSDRIKQNNFTDKRLFDAINNVIDTCEYPKPTIAKFLNYDRRIKFYNYEQYTKLINENPRLGEQYKAVKVKFAGVPMWAHVSDIQKYKLPFYKKQTTKANAKQ